jgi:hypothetical protein
MAEAIDFKGRTESAPDAESIASQTCRNIPAANFKAATPITTLVLYAKRGEIHPKILSVGGRLDLTDGGLGK